MAYESNVKQILSDLEWCAEPVNKYIERRKNIIDNYRGDELNNQLDALNTSTNSSLAGRVSILKDHLAALKNAVESVEDFNPASSDDILTTAKLLGNPGISFKTLENILQKFIGNRTALELIYSNAHDDYKSAIKGYFFDNEEAIDKMILLATSIGVNPIQMSSQLSELRSMLVRFCSKNGTLYDASVQTAMDELKARNVANIINQMNRQTIVEL